MKTKKMNLIEKAKEYACACHSSTHHLYDGKPYEVHLQMVFDAATEFIHLIPEKHREAVLAGCWVHDVIEDCRQTYNDVKAVLGTEVAELAFALTNEKGRTRKERANEKYYEGIRNTPFATYVKICDRMANFRHSIATGSRMADMYEKEMKDFISKLYDEDYEEMFSCLRTMTKQKTA